MLVNGASGGVGLMAVQIARALGAAEVVGVCGGEHFDRVRPLGADRLIDRRAEDFTAARDAYDVIFDAVGKSTYAACKPALRHDGRYVTTLPDPKQAVAYLTSIFTEKKMRPFMAKDRGSDMAQVAAWVADGRVKAIVEKTYPLQRAADAQRDNERGGTAGKIVLTID